MGAVRLHIGVNGGAFAQQRTAYFQRIGGVFAQSTGLIALFFAPAQINTGAGVDRGVGRLIRPPMLLPPMAVLARPGRVG